MPVQTIRGHHATDNEGNPDGGHTYAKGLEITWHGGECRQVRDATGCFLETVIEAAADRLLYLQGTKFACQHNADCLRHLRNALASLADRTSMRQSYGVEGTHELTPAEENYKPEVARDQIAENIHELVEGLPFAPVGPKDNVTGPDVYAFDFNFPFLPLAVTVFYIDDGKPYPALLLDMDPDTHIAHLCVFYQPQYGNLNPAGRRGIPHQRKPIDTDHCMWCTRREWAERNEPATV